MPGMEEARDTRYAIDLEVTLSTVGWDRGVFGAIVALAGWRGRERNVILSSATVKCGR